MVQGKLRTRPEMMDWADREAAEIVDEFVANQGSEDLLKLQLSIAAVIR